MVTVTVSVSKHSSNWSSKMLILNRRKNCHHLQTWTWYQPDFIVDNVELFLQHHCKGLGVGVKVTTPTAWCQQVWRVVIQYCTVIHFIVVLHTTYISIITTISIIFPYWVTQGGHKVGEKNSLSFPGFSRAINLLFRRLLQQKVNVIMTFIKGLMILFTQSTAVLHKYLNDELNILCLL